MTRTEYGRRRRETLGAAGLCFRCGTRRYRPGRRTCVPCAYYFRLKQRARGERLVSAGLCNRCGKQAPREGKVGCADCAAGDRRRRQELSRRRKVRFFDWIRRQTCCLEQCDAPYCDPAHVRSRGAGGRDRGNVVPLCRTHHNQLHAIGRDSFAAMYDVNLPRLARQYADTYRWRELDRLPF